MDAGHPVFRVRVVVPGSRLSLAMKPHWCHGCTAISARVRACGGDGPEEKGQTVRTLLQDLKSGELLVENAPSPRVGAGMVLIRTNRSLISAGTERMLASFAKGGYVSKARQQPEKVKQVIDKAKTDGLVATYEGVMDKLSQPMPMGYCNAGPRLSAFPRTCAQRFPMAYRTKRRLSP